MSTQMLDALSTMELWNITTWPWWFGISFATIIALGVELLSFIVLNAFAYARPIAIKGKHLDVLEPIDLAYIYFNRVTMVPFMYHAVQVAYYTPSILKEHSEATFSNTVGSFILFYVFYDFFYHAFHKALHIRALYPLVHKHHHRQKAPSRGNLDAINVHPFEFVTGEYLHLFTVFMVPCHVYAVIAFIAIGGILASLNHTRHDVEVPYLYSVKVHDVHHRLPETNYSQYTMLWDHLWGTYRAYSASIGFKGNDGKPTSCVADD